MKRSRLYLPSWVFFAVTFYLVGLIPLSAGGTQEIGGAIYQEIAAHTGLSDDRLNLQSLIENLAARSPEMKAARERWDAAKAVIPQVQTLFEEHWGLSNCEHLKS